MVSPHSDCWHPISDAYNRQGKPAATTRRRNVVVIQRFAFFAVFIVDIHRWFASQQQRCFKYSLDRPVCIAMAN
jgi:hypothetical protein